MNTATDSLEVVLPVTSDQPAAITAALTTITHAAPGTPDYAFGTVTTTNGAGFSSVDEALSLLKVVANLQARSNEMEAILEGLRACASN